MLLQHVRASIRQSNLIAVGDRIIVGVSGGPDSLTLLLMLKALACEYKLTLHAAHLDHMIRKASAQDANFVKRFCDRLKVPLTIKKIDVKRLAQRRSIEEVAREQRFKFFCSLAKKYGANKIALGHNLDDQAETVLMRLLRGSGLSGLSGITAQRVINGYTFIRPLINIRRKDIETYLRRRHIRARIDESNLEDAYLRNRIRHRLLPFIEKNYNNNIKQVLCNTALAAADDYDYLSQEARKAASASGTAPPIKKLTRMHPAIRRMVLRINFKRLKGDTRALEFRHIHELEALLFNRPVRSIVDLPRNISVIKTKNALRFYKR